MCSQALNTVYSQQTQLFGPHFACVAPSCYVCGVVCSLHPGGTVGRDTFFVPTRVKPLTTESRCCYKAVAPHIFLSQPLPPHVLDAISLDSCHHLSFCPPPNHSSLFPLIYFCILIPLSPAHLKSPCFSGGARHPSATSTD